MLKAENLQYRTAGRQIIAPLDLALEPGRLHAILGPNGAGKSSLLKLLSGEWRGQHGAVSLHGRRLGEWPAAELARVRAVLPQYHALSFPFSAAEVVALGRLQTRRHSVAGEREIVHAALECCGAAHLASRPYPRLSGGERARVQLARVLAQIWDDDTTQARYLLLDEPTAHLDLAYQHACLRLAREWTRRGAGVVAVLHDPNLVLSYADQVHVIQGGQLLARGEPAQTLQPALMKAVYGLQMQRHVDAQGRAFLMVQS